MAVLESGSITVKYVVLALLLSVGYLSAQQQAAQPPAPPAQPQAIVRAIPPANPAIDMDGYLKVANEAAKHRATHRLTEDEFIKMSQEKGAIVLDARSKEMYDLKHVKGAINLSFPNIDIESLKKTLPDKERPHPDLLQQQLHRSGGPTPVTVKGQSTRLQRRSPSKAPVASLNISTYISLYSYGYKNVYELAPLIDPARSRSWTFVEKEGAR